MQRGLHHSRRAQVVKEVMNSVLEQIPKYGSFSGACEASGVTYRTFARWRRKYPIYDRLVEQQVLRRAEKLKDVAYDWAVNGITTRHYDKDGDLKSETTRPAEKLLVEALRVSFPQEYAPREDLARQQLEERVAMLERQGGDEKPVLVVPHKISHEQWVQQAHVLRAQAKNRENRELREMGEKK